MNVTHAGFQNHSNNIVRFNGLEELTDKERIEYFNKLYNQSLVPWKHRYFTKINIQDYEDAFNEGYNNSYKVLMQTPDKFTSWGRFINYMKVSVRNSINNARRNQKTTLEVTDYMKDNIAEEPTVNDKINYETILEKIYKTGENSRGVRFFKMYAVDGLSYQEIADKFGISVNTVKPLIHKGRQELQPVINEMMGTNRQKKKKKSSSNKK